jgi:hypothetical protein
MTSSDHQTWRRPAWAIAAAATFAALCPAAANAALSIQPNAPALGFPASVTDPVSGIALGPCQDTSGFCLETPAPNQAAPLSVPDNFTPDGEAFYSEADTVVPNAGLGVVVLALEQAFVADPPAAGGQIMFARTRFRFTTLKPNTTYRITYPYGVTELASDDLGKINNTVDAGCLGPPCDFATANLGVMTSFLEWDPTVAPAAPAGYVGNAAVLHKVIGSPFGTNLVRLEELDGPGGLPVATVGETDSFHVQGKLAGPAPAPAAFAIPDTNALHFADRQVGTTSPASNITLTNHGTADLTVADAAIGGADAGDYAIASNACATAVAPGQSCAIGITFAPAATGARAATLTVNSNSLNAPHTFTLGGTGMAPTINGPTPAPLVVRVAVPGQTVAISPRSTVLRAARVHATRTVKVSQARGHGLVVTFAAPADAGVARLRLLPAKGKGSALATKLVALERSGRQSIHLRARHVRPGRYRVEVTVGATARKLGPPVFSPVTVTR